MRALIISDLHAHLNWPLARPTPDGLTDRFGDLLSVLDQVSELIRQHRPHTLLILGDLLHRRYAISFKLFDALASKIALLSGMVRETLILVGNHDYEDSQTHGLRAFGWLPGVTVMSQPGVIKLCGEDVFALPYLHDPLAMAAAVEHAPSDLILLGHYACEGVPLESGYWLPSPLKLGEMGKFRRAYFGHIHKPSEQAGGHVVNAGSLLHQDWGDVGDRYAVLVDGDTYTRLPLQFPRFMTAKFPRIPMPAVHSGYLRIQGVPAAAAQEVRQQALALGWRDCLTDQEVLPEETRAAIADGTLVNRELLAAHVLKRCPEMPEAEQQDLVDVGERFLGQS